MTGGATVEAEFTSKDKDILVDLKFEKKKGLFWNPLNLLGVGSPGKDDQAGEREELKKRVNQLEKRLCFITEKIDKCEGSRTEDEEKSYDSEEKENEDSRYTDCKANQNYMVTFKQPKLKKQCRANGRIVIDRCQMKDDQKVARSRRSGTPNRNRLDSISIPWDCKATYWEKNNIDKKSVVWDKPATWEKATKFETKATSPIWDKKIHVASDYTQVFDWNFVQTGSDQKVNAWNMSESKEKSCNWEGSMPSKKIKVHQKEQRSTQVQETFKPVTDQCVMHSRVVSTTKNPWYDIQPGDQVKAVRSGSDEPITKKNIKSIIDEAVVASISKSLQRYFKDSIEGYIKKRVDSAVKYFKEPERFHFITPEKSYSKPLNQLESVDNLKEYKSKIKDHPSSDLVENEESSSQDTLVGSSNKSISTSTLPETKHVLYGRRQHPSKLLSKAASPTWKYRGGELKSTFGKKDFGVKPVSAPSYIKDVLISSQAGQSRPSGLVRSNLAKPSPSDRNVQKRNFREKISKES